MYKTSSTPHPAHGVEVNDGLLRPGSTVWIRHRGEDAQEHLCDQICYEGGDVYGRAPVRVRCGATLFDPGRCYLSADNARAAVEAERKGRILSLRQELARLLLADADNPVAKFLPPPQTQE